MDKNKLFYWINIGLAVALGLFIYFDKILLGLGITFTFMGVLSLLAVVFNTEPMGTGIGGFDYAMKLLFKEYYNRYFNLFWGLIKLIIGIGCILKLIG